MIYAARKMVESVLTVSAINAKIALLNTAYSLTGANAVPNVAAVADGAVITPEQLSGFPGVLHYVGTAPAPGETVQFAKRDIPHLAVAVAYHTKAASKADARKHTDITLEALLPLLEALQGTEFGSTGRQIVQVSDPAMSFAEFSVEGAGVRFGGTLTCTMWARAQGV